MSTASGKRLRLLARVYVLPESAHSPLVEVPEQTVAITRRFLAETAD